MRLGPALLALALAACEDKKPPPAPGTPEPVASIVESLDASALGEPSDPPAPAGDLKVDLERFVNVDTCVAERAKLDPLLGDALGAIGYETFIRDACRLLEATKDKKRETCDKIDASPLRLRCQSWVAIVSESPDSCPLQFEGLATRGRAASCVAIASKDPRLCAGEGRIAARATCEAMVGRDPAKCEALLPGQRAACRRDVTRWRSLLPAPLEGLEKLPPARAKLVVHGANGTADPSAMPPESELGSDFDRGAVVVSARTRSRVEIGTVAESESARVAVSPQRRPRIGLALLFDDEKSAPVIDKLELELPGEPLIVSPPAACACKLVGSHLSPKRAGELAVKLEGTISAGTRSYAISLDLTTFVRDVVPEDAGGSRVLPPIHPALIKRQ